MDEEKDLWLGSPSQVNNLTLFIFMIILSPLIIPLFVILWKWLDTKTTKYEITTERIRTRRGILSKTTEEIELYRVRDYRLEQPILLRMFSLGNIILQTSDRSHPEMTLTGIPKGEELRELLRTNVEKCRAKKQVREVDFQ
jgi:uncharacterized membrane protein YdbT with pleckstrin-like domain